MIQLLGLFLTMLTPLTGPVAGGAALEFRMIQGLVPAPGWKIVPGIPLRRTGTFSELTYHTGGRGSFRVLSSGPTAGIHPSIGSLVGGGGYAGWLSAADATVSLCDHGNYSLASTYRGFTLDYRENSGFFGGYSSERFQAAGGPEAFVAGISPAIGEGFSLGPAWCEDRHGGSAWLRGSFSRGALLVETGGAVEEDRALPRARATLASGGLMASAGYDRGKLFGQAGLSPEFLVQWPRWGVSCLFEPRDDVLLFMSHATGGRFSAEFQIAFHGISGGFTFTRMTGGRMAGGFTGGIFL